MEKKNWKLSKEKKEAIRKVKNHLINSDCSYCKNCKNCFYCKNCKNSSNLSHSSYCYNCYNCYDSSYKISNVQFTKEEYEAWKKGLI